MATNVPPVTFGANGFIAPSEADILAGIIADINAAFGGGVNPALNTPQGQLASSESAIVGNVNDTFVLLTNLVDPAYSYGRMQDAIGRIYFLERIPSAPTVVQATCTGLTGVIIPVGALAIAADGNLYTCTEAGEIPVGGAVTLSFVCNVVGPIACPADSLNKIYQAIPGWDSVNNASDGVLGANVESRAAFEERRAATVAANSNGSLPSIQGAVLNVAGVLDAYVTENDTNAPLTRGGVTLAKNSLYVAVVGGVAQDVAQAIWSRKAPGCSYNGNTTEVVLDESAAYNPPYPAYNVTFETPDSLSIMFHVRLTNNNQVPANAETLVQNAIILAFSGADGGPRARIGSTVYASRYYAPVALLGAWVQIVAIEVGSINNPAATFTAAIAGTNMTVSAVASGVLAVGQTIADALDDVVTGTTIVSQTSGPAGGTGVYVVSNSQTVSSRTIYASLADRDQIITRIDQSPTISADNIVVTLV